MTNISPYDQNRSIDQNRIALIFSAHMKEQLLTKKEKIDKIFLELVLRR